MNVTDRCSEALLQIPPRCASWDEWEEHRAHCCSTNTNYNVCFVLCLSLRTHARVTDACRRKPACSRKRTCILMHTPQETPLSLRNSPSHSSEGTGLFSIGMIPFPLWLIAHTTLSHPVTSNRPIQLHIPTHTRSILPLLNHNPNRMKDQLRNMY